MNKNAYFFRFSILNNTLVWVLYTIFIIAWIFAVCGIALPFIVETPALGIPLYNWQGYMGREPVTPGGRNLYVAYASQVVAVVFGSLLLVTFWTPMIKTHTRNGLIWVLVLLGIQTVFQIVTMSLIVTGYDDLNYEYTRVGFQSGNSIIFGTGLILCIVSWALSAVLFALLFWNKAKIIAGEEVAFFGVSFVAKNTGSSANDAGAGATAGDEAKSSFTMNKITRFSGLAINNSTLIWVLWPFVVIACAFAFCPFFVYFVINYTKLSGVDSVKLSYQYTVDFFHACVMQVMAVIFLAPLVVTFWTPMIKGSTHRAFVWVMVALAASTIFQFLTMCFGASGYVNLNDYHNQRKNEPEMDIDKIHSSSRDTSVNVKSDYTLGAGFIFCIVSCVICGVVFCLLFVNRKKIVAGEEIPVFGKSFFSDASESSGANGDAGNV